MLLITLAKNYEMSAVVTSFVLHKTVTTLLLSAVHCAWVYILTNKRHTTLYVGVTNNIRSRLWEHTTKQDQKSFTSRYNLCKLIYYEGFDSIDDAIYREKFIKGKTRKWKEELIASKNPNWTELKIPD